MSGRVGSPLRKFVAPEIIHGPGAIDLAGECVSRFHSRRTLMVTDPGVREAGWSDRVQAQLETMGIEVVAFVGITPNPKSREVMAGVQAYNDGECDVIVAVGGGSAMDCAKGVGIAATGGRHVLDFAGVDEIDVPGPPLICVPTTAGSSADVSQFAIVTDETRRAKAALISKLLVPDIALIDPQTTSTLSRDLAACTGLDVLSHAFEAYVSTASSPLTDLHALEAARLVFAWLARAVQDTGDDEARAHVMTASLHAGLAFSNASLGAVHAMSHSLGGQADLPHGECNAILIDAVVRFNFPSCPQRYRALAGAAGIEVDPLSDGDVLEALLARIGALRAEVGIVTTLGSRGISRDRIASLAQGAVADPCMVTNPRVPTLAEISELYEQAL